MNQYDNKNPSTGQSGRARDDFKFESQTDSGSSHKHFNTDAKTAQSLDRRSRQFLLYPEDKRDEAWWASQCIRLKLPLITISRYWLSVDFIHAGKWRLDEERYKEIETLIKQCFPRHAKCLGFGNFVFIRLKASESMATRKFADELLRLFKEV